MKTAQQKEIKEKADLEKKILINYLLGKDVSIENIAKILEIIPKAVTKIIDKKIR